MADQIPQNTETTINLNNDVTVNGVKYRKGQGVTVPKAQASDIERIDYEHNQYKERLHTSQKYETNAGTISMGDA